EIGAVLIREALGSEHAGRADERGSDRLWGSDPGTLVGGNIADDFADCAGNEIGMQLTASAAKSGGVGATGHHGFVAYAGEAAVVRRGNVGAEGSVRDDATGLGGGVAERHVLKGAANIFPLGHRNSTAQEQSGND